MEIDQIMEDATLAHTLLKMHSNHFGKRNSKGKARLNPYTGPISPAPGQSKRAPEASFKMPYPSELRQ